MTANTDRVRKFWKAKVRKLEQQLARERAMQDHIDFCKRVGIT